MDLLSETRRRSVRDDLTGQLVAADCRHGGLRVLADPDTITGAAVAEALLPVHRGGS